MGSCRGSANYRERVNSASRPRPRTLWEHGRRPGFDVASLTVALLLTATVLNLALAERLGLFFDLIFVTLCVAAALSVRLEDFFPVGVLPPLAMLLVVVLLALSDPGSVARPTDGVVQATVSGLAGHALALALGYAVALGLLATRRMFLAQPAR